MECFLKVLLRALKTEIFRKRGPTKRGLNIYWLFWSKKLFQLYCKRNFWWQFQEFQSTFVTSRERRYIKSWLKNNSKQVLGTRIGAHFTVTGDDHRIWQKKYSCELSLKQNSEWQNIRLLFYDQVLNVHSKRHSKDLDQSTLWSGLYTANLATENEMRI